MRIIRSPYVFIFTFFCIAGCVPNIVYEINPSSLPKNESEKVSLKASLILVSGICEYEYKRLRAGTTYTYKLGNTMCDYFEKISRDIFIDVNVLSNSNITFYDDMDVSIIPEVTAVNLHVPQWSGQTQRAIILIEWTISDNQNQVIWVDTVRGEGHGKMGTTFTGRKRDTEIMEKALKDVFLKSRDSILSSNEVRTFEASHR